MKIRNIILLLPLIAAALLQGCGSPLAPFEQSIINQQKDEIAPEIKIVYPEDNSAYSKLIFISGNTTDVLNEEGAAGRVVEVGYSVLGTVISGTAEPSEEDGSFSFLIDTQSFSGNNITVKLTAEDLKGNLAETTLNLVYQNSDIASFSITPGNRSASMSWENPPETESLRLHNILSGEEVLLDEDTETYTWNSLENGKLAFFQLFAEDTRGNTNVSDIVSTMPMSPYTLFPDVNGNVNQVTISWPALEDADRYVVERAEERNGSYEIKFITGGSSVIDTGLSADEDYYYRIYPEEYSTIKSDAARIRPLSYGTNWTDDGSLSIGLGGVNSGTDTAVYNTGGDSYIYYTIDGYSIGCIKYDNTGILIDLGEVIDLSGAADSVLDIIADDDNGILFVMVGEEGVYVYDLSAPETPVVDASSPYSFGLPGDNFYFNAPVVQENSGNYYLYLIYLNSILQIEYSYSTLGGLSVNATDSYDFPTSPAQVSSSGHLYYETADDPYTQIIHAHYYCSVSGYQKEGVYSFDVSTPSSWDSPSSTVISSDSFEGCSDLVADGGRLALLRNDGAGIYESDGTLVGEVALSGIMNSLALDGEFLLVSSSSRGVKILNINSLVPAEIGSYSTSDFAKNVLVVDGRDLAVTNTTIEEFIIDVPDAFTFSSYYTGPNWQLNYDAYYSAAIIDDSLFIGRQKGTTIYNDLWDISGTAPSAAQRLSIPKGFNFAGQGSRLAVSDIYYDPEPGLYLNSLSSGVIINEYAGAGNYDFMSFRNDNLYCAVGQRLYVFHAPDNSGLTELSSALLDNQIGGSMSFKDDYIYIPLYNSGGLSVLKENEDHSLEYAGTIQSDIFSDGNQVYLVDSEVVDDYLYVAYRNVNVSLSTYETGVIAFSLSNPSSPAEVSRYEYSFGGTSELQYIISKLEVSGHLLMALTGDGGSGPSSMTGRGIHMLDISDPSEMREIGEIDFSEMLTDFYDETTLILGYGLTATSRDFVVDGNDIYFTSRYCMFHIEY